MKAIYSHLLECLIELNKENRKNHKEYESILSPIGFVLEFGTIKLDVGRAVGKSYFIKNHATEKDLILTFSHNQANEFRDETKAVIISNPTSDILHAYSSKNFETIYIDEPYLTFKNIDMQDALNCLIHNTEQTIIILGK